MTQDTEKTAIGVVEDGDATQVVSQPQVEATEFSANVDCPVCHTPNPPSETYCIDCGFLLSSEPIEAGETLETPMVGTLVTVDGTREFTLKPGENTVGRQDADVLLSHNTVSRKHAVIVAEDGRVWVEDVGSTNGTTVAGRKLEPGEKMELTDGVEIVFGSQALIFKAEGTPEPPKESEPETAAAAAEEGLSETSAASAEEGSEEVAEVEAAPIVGRLVSTDGKLVFDVREGVMTIGRRGTNDVVVPDPYCSGSHAELKAEGGQFTITDVGSTNGTLVNGVKIEPNSPRVVLPGDELTLGNTVFRIEMPQ